MWSPSFFSVCCRFVGARPLQVNLSVHPRWVTSADFFVRPSTVGDLYRFLCPSFHGGWPLQISLSVLPQWVTSTDHFVCPSTAGDLYRFLYLPRWATSTDFFARPSTVGTLCTLPMPFSFYNSMYISIILMCVFIIGIYVFTMYACTLF